MESQAEPITLALQEAARRRGILIEHLDPSGLLQLSDGKQRRRIRGTQTDRTSAVAQTVAYNNLLTRNLLREIGLPVPETCLVASAEEAWSAAQSLGSPVLIKRQYGTPVGQGVPLNTRVQVEAAFAQVAERTSYILVEPSVPGLEHLLLVVGNQVVAAVRCDQYEPNLPETFTDVTSSLSPEVADRAISAVRMVGLDVAEVSLVATDLAEPLEEQAGAIMAVRYDIDLLPYEARMDAIADELVALLFPPA